ncbi:hypothetical protein FO519_004851 [Halicephalobus sp. NKZ332]|nr:hypothetical protein FO519_004851 [Halicephalobus sp. NKZ332]
MKKADNRDICAIETQVNAELESVKAEIAELKDKGSAYMQKYETASEQIEKQEMEAFRASPAYVYWVEKIYPRVLYTYSCGFKRCVIPFFRDFGLTYRHGQHKNLVIGDKIMIYAERNKNFGEPFEASVVDFDDSLDVVLLKAPDGRVFTKVRFYGSSGCSNGDIGSGCYDRYGRLIGINVAVACTPVHVVESTSAVQLIGGKNAITPAIAIFVQFKKYLPVIEKKHIIE